MMLNDRRIQMEWVAACLAPTDVAPHPNFRTDRAEGAELLSLIVLFRSREYNAYRDLNASDDTAEMPEVYGARILDAAQRAMDWNTTAEGLGELFALVEDDQLSLGARTASALLAATASAELDRPEIAIGTLSALGQKVRESAIGSTSSRNLAAAALFQQAAMRAVEAGQLSDARVLASEATMLLTETGEQWEEFPVSKGISWSAAESQVRLAQLISGNAQSILVTTGNPADKSWAVLVRSPFPQAAVRPARDALSALVGTLDDLYKHSYFSPRNRRLFLGDKDSDLRLLYSALLRVELSGDLAETARLRRTLATVFATKLIQRSGDASEYAEAIRLFRQADATDQFQRLLDQIRRQGPLESLKRAAESLISTRQPQSYTTSTDLALLRWAADLISPSYTTSALEIALRYASQDRDGRVKLSYVSSSKQVEVALGVTGALIAGNSQVDMEHVARSALATIGSVNPSNDNFVLTAIARLSSRIIWREVSPATKTGWLSLLDQWGNSPGISAIDRLRVRTEIDDSRSTVMEKRLTPLEFVVALIEGLLGTPSADDLDKAVAIITEAVVTIQRDAQSGRATTYKWSPLQLAALLISHHKRSVLWPLLVEALYDPKVSNQSKTEALKALTAAAMKITMPADIKAVFAHRPIPQADEPADGIFTISSPAFQSHCRNFYAAYQLSHSSHIRDGILKDVASRDVDTRANAAAGCRLVAARNLGLEWPQIVLLQLTYDSESHVREEASRALAYLSIYSQAVLIDAVTDRVRSLANEPGIAVAMGVLEGLYEALIDLNLSADSLWCRESVQTLLNTHLSQSVREAAREVLSR
ncbi:hypothetical protein E1292_37670 [Nonomuraea deserti]|uniref:Uncharacterized protein n=1 Tax=Nonomuraea deserti TaxID=1848322 RepID=A0A4R4UWW7_9ACTN|nr:hypothetical protein [Nonomuraea deserti]TDC97128.1 hypothetical protein E1292_37670 [Nonomuraea deserti]